MTQTLKLAGVRFITIQFMSIQFTSIRNNPLLPRITNEHPAKTPLSLASGQKFRIYGGAAIQQNHHKIHQEPPPFFSFLCLSFSSHTYRASIGGCKVARCIHTHACMYVCICLYNTIVSVSASISMSLSLSMYIHEQTKPNKNEQKKDKLRFKPPSNFTLQPSTLQPFNPSNSGA